MVMLLFLPYVNLLVSELLKLVMHSLSFTPARRCIISLNVVQKLCTILHGRLVPIC